jgi:uncharacterized protein YfaS (alpha-2-macroglobulin family)
MEVRVTVRNTQTQPVPEIALVHALPASWELINYRLGDTSADGTAANSDANATAPPASYKYQDIRDDCVMTYFDLAPGAAKTIRFHVNRAYNGNFFRPAIQVYAMYDESISALIPGRRSE